MRTSIVKSIFLKEIKEIIRDKNQLFFLIMMPFFLYPFLLLVMGQVMSVQKNKMDSTTVEVVINENLKNSPIYDWLKEEKQFNISLGDVDAENLNNAENTLGLSLNNNYQHTLQKNGSIDLQIFYDGTEDLMVRSHNKIQKIIEKQNEELLNQRLIKAALNPDFVQPIELEEINIASAEKQTGNMISKFIPGILLLLIFTGTIYVALDISAGEKERKTLQSLYIAPVKVSEIIGGKFLAVFGVGLISGLANMLSLAGTVLWQKSMATSAAAAGAEVTSAGFSLAVSPVGWLWIILLVILTTCIISGINLAVLLQANTYKEAQGYVTPLMIGLMLPSFLYAMPGMELNTSTVFIPILNVLLAISAILKGIVEPQLLFLVTIVSIIFSLLALQFASFAFSNESIITGQRVNYRKLLQSNPHSKRIFGASEAIVFFAVVLLVFMVFGSQMQMKLGILWGIPSSFILILGGLSLAVILFYKLDVKQALHLNMPSLKATLATILLAAVTWVPVGYIYSLFDAGDHSEYFLEMLQPLINANFFIGLTIIAVFPAIFEELVFRGVMFRGLKNEWGKWPVILVTAFTFGLMHMDLYRMLPTTLIGVLLGYILWQSGSIYLTALFHFLHNGLSFVIMRFGSEEMASAESVPLTWVIPALAVMGLGIFILSKEIPPSETRIEGEPNIGGAELA